MRFLNWNILAGGGSRIEAITRCIAQKLPEAGVITEYRPGKSGEVLKSALRRMGHGYIHEAAAAEGQNSVLVFGSDRLVPLENDLQIPGHLCPFVAHGTVMGNIILGVYCPTQSVGKAMIAFLAGLKGTNRGASIIAAGDFFFGPRASDKSHGKPLKALEEKGWINAWDRYCGDSDFWTHEGRGKSRPDHIFLLGEARERLHSLEVSPEPMSMRVSDHAPVMATFHMHPCSGAF